MVFSLKTLACRQCNTNLTLVLPKNEGLSKSCQVKMVFEDRRSQTNVHETSWRFRCHYMMPVSPPSSLNCRAARILHLIFLKDASVKSNATNPKFKLSSISTLKKPAEQLRIHLNVGKLESHFPISMACRSALKTL